MFVGDSPKASVDFGAILLVTRKPCFFVKIVVIYSHQARAMARTRAPRSNTAASPLASLCHPRSVPLWSLVRAPAAVRRRVPVGPGSGEEECRGTLDHVGPAHAEDIADFSAPPIQFK